MYRANTRTNKEDLDTIWRVPDALWEKMSKVLSVYDTPAKVGRPRINQRLAMDALIYRLRTGCQWNYLPQEFGWGMSVYRTFRRWEARGIFDILWALLLLECEEMGGVDWRWQAADGCLGKARGVPKRGHRTNASAETPPIEPRRASRKACLSRPMAAHLQSALPEPMFLTSAF